MTKPTRFEYALPPDAYARRSKLIGEREGGVLKWTIKSDAVSQRDEGEIIRSLTTAQLIEIGRIAGQEK